MYLTKQYFFVVVLFSLSLLNSSCSSPSRISKVINMDNEIEYGKLNNGLTYYIKPLKSDHSGIKMHFYVRTGDYNEKPEQIGFAHAIEHLAFRETKNFSQPLTSDKERLAALGLTKENFFGYTYSIGTLYTLDIPHNNPDAVNLGLSWFREIAENLEISDHSVEREKGVLRQEFYKTEGNKEEIFATASLYSKLFPCRNSLDSFYNVNENFSPKDLRDFYDKWYRPELMALAVVGDIEKVKPVKNSIKSTFSNLKSSKEPTSTLQCDMDYFRSKPKYVLVERRKDSTRVYNDESSSVLLFYRDPYTEKGITTLNDLKKQITGKVLSAILSKRIDYFLNSSVKNFSVSNVHTSTLLSSPSALKVKLRIEENNEKEAVYEVVQFLKQLGEKGVKTEELEIAKKAFLKELNQDTSSPKYWLDQISEHFFRNVSLPPHKLDSVINFIDDLSPESLNERAQELLLKQPEDIGIVIPSNSGKKHLTEKSVRNWIKTAYTMPVKAYETPRIPVSIINEERLEQLQEKKIVSQLKNEVGAKEYILANGLKVVLKSFKPSPGINKNRVLLHGFSSKGAGCFPETDRFSAINSPLIVRNSGVGNLTNFQIKETLSRTSSLRMGVVPYINYYESGIKASVANYEIDKLLQLIYLYFTEPNKDRLSFEEWRSNSLYESHSLFENSGLDFGNTVEKVIDSTFLPSMGSMWSSGLLQTNYEKSLEIYKTIFGRPQDFTFIITGDFKEAEVLSKVNRYLGNIPVLFEKDFCDEISNFQGDLPKQRTYKLNAPGLAAERAIYGLKFFKKAEQKNTLKNEIKIMMLGQILNLKLKKLRIEEGLAIYNAGAAGSIDREKDMYEISLTVEGDLRELPIIKTNIVRYINEIRSLNIEKDEVIAAKNYLKHFYFEEAMRRNKNVQKYLYRYLKFGEEWKDSAEGEKYLNSFTIEDFSNFANEFLDEQNRFEFVMEKGPDSK